jgi:manganese-dependent inorganic pyrophosphatase
MTTPRLFLIEPVGSTSTALFFLYQKYRTPVPDWVARCMLAAIVSDTLNLRGPTTTSDDRVRAAFLLALAIFVSL